MSWMLIIRAAVLFAAIGCGFAGARSWLDYWKPHPLSAMLGLKFVLFEAIAGTVLSLGLLILCVVL